MQPISNIYAEELKDIVNEGKESFNANYKEKVRQICDDSLKQFQAFLADKIEQNRNAHAQRVRWLKICKTYYEYLVEEGSGGGGSVKALFEEMLERSLIREFHKKHCTTQCKKDTFASFLGKVKEFQSFCAAGDSTMVLTQMKRSNAHTKKLAFRASAVTLAQQELTQSKTVDLQNVRNTTVDGIERFLGRVKPVIQAIQKGCRKVQNLKPREKSLLAASVPTLIMLLSRPCRAGLLAKLKLSDLHTLIKKRILITPQSKTSSTVPLTFLDCSNRLEPWLKMYINHIRPYLQNAVRTQLLSMHFVPMDIHKFTTFLSTIVMK